MADAMNTDRNLLFGVLALQADLIDAERFAEACAAWAARKERSLGALMVERGWISETDRADVERLMQRKLAKHAGDPRASLADAAAGRDEALRLLEALNDSEIQRSVAGLTVARGARGGHVLLSTMTHEPETRERYTLTRLHAKGGLGQVWLARDGDLGREVALKEIRPEQARNPMVWRRFLEEARVTGQLEHPGIVPVYELTRRAADQQPFYTMRFVKGRTLTEAIRAFHRDRPSSQARKLDQVTLLNAFIAVCNAVAYAHSRGVIHRDLKGQNVVLGDFGEAIVLDWGLAKRVGQVPEGDKTLPPPVDVDPEAEHGRTLQGQVLGTPAYMSPEQAEGRLDQVDQRSDVYGLGAILYEILTDQPPFSGGTTEEVLRRVREEEPQPPRAVRPEAPPALAAVCLKALAKRPEARYATASELAQEVQRFLADEPVVAYREPVTVRLGRWTRRHKTLVASAAMLLGTAVVALSISTVMIGRQRAEAQANFELAREAVDRYFVQVSENRLLNEPGMQPLRKELLETAEEFYREFVSRQAGNPQVRAEQAKAYIRLAKITHEIEAIAPSRAYNEQAIAILEELLANDPGSADYRDELARACLNLGTLDREMGQTDHVLARYQRALSLWNDLVREYPDEDDYQDRLARCHNNLGNLYIDMGLVPRSEHAFQQAVAIWERLADATRETPESLDYRNLIGRAYVNLADLYRIDGQALKSEHFATRAVAELEALDAERSGIAQHRRSLAGAYMNLGNAYAQLGRLRQAEEVYRKGLEVCEQLVRENPAVIDYQDALASALISLGSLTGDQGRLETAEVQLKNALEVLEQRAAVEPDVLSHQRTIGATHYNLATLYYTLGRFEEARESWLRALDIRRTLTDGANARLEDRINLAWTYNDLANLYSLTLGLPDLAEDAFQQALSLFDELLRFAPDHAGRRADLATTLGNLAIFRQESGALQEAERLFLRALETERSLIAVDPGSPRFADNLARTYNNIGYLYRAMGRYDEAIESWEQARDLWDDLACRIPEVQAYRNRLAVVQDGLGVLVQKDERWQEAGQNLRRAVALFDALVEETPQAVEPRVMRSQSLRNLAQLHQDLHEYGQAEQVLQTAVDDLEAAARENPAIVAFRENLAKARALLGIIHATTGQTDPAESSYLRALELFEQLEAEQPRRLSHRQERYRVLWNLSRLHQQRSEPDPSNDRLLQAIQLNLSRIRDDSDESAWRDLGSCLRALTIDHATLSQHGASIESALREAVSALERGVEEASDDIAISLNLMFGLLKLFTFEIVSGRADEADEVVCRAVAIGQRLVDNEPDDTEPRLALFRLHQEFGRMYRDVGHMAKALEALSRAVGPLESVVHDHPENAEWQWDLALLLDELGHVEHANGRSKEAYEAFRRSIAVREPVVAAHPQNLAAALQLAAAYGSLGHVLRTDGNVAESIPWYGRAIDALDRLIAQDVEEATREQAIAYLRYALAGRALARESEGRPDEADADWSRALALSDDAARNSLRLQRAGERLRRGPEGLESLAEVDAVVGSDTLEMATLYDAACAYALASAAVRSDTTRLEPERATLAEDYARRAIQLLRQGAADGWFGDPSLRELLKTDSDLDPIRDREDFRALVNEQSLPGHDQEQTGDAGALNR